METCPSWCTDSHAQDGSGSLGDVSHSMSAPGLKVPSIDGDGSTVAMPVLDASLVVYPYDRDARYAKPYVAVTPWQDESVELREPAELAAMIADVRAVADRWERLLCQFEAARAEWAERAVPSV